MATLGEPQADFLPSEKNKILIKQYKFFYNYFSWNSQNTNRTRRKNWRVKPCWLRPFLFPFLFSLLLPDE